MRNEPMKMHGLDHPILGVGVASGAETLQPGAPTAPTVELEMEAEKG